ncbi:hypothetical protein GQ457_04G025630 [Hibiscus cannabinus]
MRDLHWSILLNANTPLCILIFFCSFHANFYYETNRFLIFPLLAVSKLNNNDQLLAGIQDSRQAQEHPYGNLSLLL